MNVASRARTGGIPLRRRALYPTEVMRLMYKKGANSFPDDVVSWPSTLAFFTPRAEVNLGLRRRPLYPAELRRRIQFLAYFLGFLTFGSHPRETGSLDFG